MHRHAPIRLTTTFPAEMKSLPAYEAGAVASSSVVSVDTVPLVPSPSVDHCAPFHSPGTIPKTDSSQLASMSPFSASTERALVDKPSPEHLPRTLAMSDPKDSVRPTPLPFPNSLCHRCAAPPKYIRTRNSVFIFCPLLPNKYPPQPVLECALFKPREPGAVDTKR